MDNKHFVNVQAGKRHKKGLKGMKHFVFIDEAQLILDNDQMQKKASLPKILEALQLARSFLITFFLFSNTPSSLGRIVHMNTGLKLIFGLSENDNAITVAKTLSLTPKQASCIPKMQPTELIISGKHPCKIKTLPFPHILKIISDEEAKKICEPILSKYKHTQRTTEKEKKEKQLSPPLKSLLWEIKSHPEKSKTQISASLGLSAGKADTQYKKIQHLTKEVIIPTGKRGCQPKHLVLTKEAHDLLGISYEGSRGEDVIHGFHIQRYTKQLTNAGIKASTNYRLSNKSADIGIILSNKEIIAIEISLTTSAEWELGQAQRNLEAGFSKVIIITATKNKAEKLSTLITNSIAHENILVSEVIQDITILINKLPERRKKR